MFGWLRKKFANIEEEDERPQHLQISLNKIYQYNAIDTLVLQADNQSHLMQKLTMEVAKRDNDNENKTVLRTNPGGDMRRRRVNMSSSSTLKSIGDKGDNKTHTIPKIDMISDNNKDDASSILPAVEEIYQYEHKLQQLLKESENRKVMKAQQEQEQQQKQQQKQKEKPSSVMESITKMQDDEVKEIFKRKFKEQLIINKQKSKEARPEDNTIAAVDDGPELIEITPNLGEKYPDSSTRIWKGAQIKESVSREYSTSFGRITLRESDLPKKVRETTDTSLDLTQRKASILSEQVNKMKYGMEKLNSVLNSNYTEKYKKDIDFLIANIAPHIQKWEKEKGTQKSKLMVIPEQKETPTAVP